MLTKLKKIFNGLLEKLYATDMLKIAIIAGIPLSIIVPSLFLTAKAFKGTSNINAENASQFGDFVGGYLGTILSFVSVVLILYTIKQQRDYDLKTEKSHYYEKFERIFFEFIRIHRDNASELRLRSVTGKKVFVVLLREFREIYTELNNLLSKNHYEFNLSTKDKHCIAYCIFFYGVGPNSSRILKNSLIKIYDSNLVDDIELYFNNDKTKKRIMKKRNFEYKPAEGHQSRLGHYYRHLFQAFSYVAEQPAEKMDEETKYKYAKMLRTQLTNHEQALLFLNSISTLGSDWINKDLISKFQLIKNLPEEFFDNNIEIDIKQIYPNIEFEFE